MTLIDPAIKTHSCIIMSEVLGNAYINTSTIYCIDLRGIALEIQEGPETFKSKFARGPKSMDNAKIENLVNWPENMKYIQCGLTLGFVGEKN